jgi:hypothetical protein
VTAAQRLRLVLALGVINLILATVALSVGITGIQSPPATAGGSTPPVAFVSPAPTGATPTSTTPTTPPGPTENPPATSTPGTPESPAPTVEPSASVEPVPSASAVPASDAPSDVPTTPPVAVVPTRAPVLGVAGSGRPRPTATTPPAAPTTSPTNPPDTAGDCIDSSAAGCGPDKVKPAHLSKDAKAAAHARKKAEHRAAIAAHHATHRGAQPATVENPRKHPKSGRRLRKSRRPR